MVYMDCNHERTAREGYLYGNEVGNGGLLARYRRHFH